MVDATEQAIRMQIDAIDKQITRTKMVLWFASIAILFVLTTIAWTLLI